MSCAAIDAIDARLSKDGTVSCGTCHDPAHAWAEPRKTSTGVGGKVGARNAPTVINRLFSIFTLNGIGAYSGDGGPAVDARLYGAEGLGTDADGKTFIADMRNGRIRMVDTRGGIITVAGTGLASFSLSPDGMPGTLVNAGCPGALTVGPDGRVYYPDLYTSAIRVLTLVSY